MLTKKIIIFLILMLFLLITPAEAESNCGPGTKVTWNGKELKAGQIGKVTVMKDTTLYTLKAGKAQLLRKVKAKESWPVYAASSSRLDLGHGVFITKDTRIKLELAPTNLTEQVACIQVEDLNNSAHQKIIVKTSKTTNTSAKLYTYEKRNGKWVQIQSNVPAVVGKLGTGKMREGDARTPIGTFSLGTSFGWGKKPEGMLYPYKAVTKHDYWVDDVQSNDYNKWVQYTGNPEIRWNSYERLTHPLYKFSLVIHYNSSPIINGEGSAIFLHTKTNTTKYTLGCVAISEQELYKLLKWLDPKKKPIIQIENS